MCRRLYKLVLPIFWLSQISARPASYDEYLAVVGDSAAVGSYRREIRQPLPYSIATEVKDLLSSGNAPKSNIKNASGKSDEGGYYKTYGSDADGEKGYLKATYSKGDHGYKTLDTFHKQGGDKYEFEEHTAYGKARAAEEGSNHGKSGSHSTQDHDTAGTRVYEHEAESEGLSEDGGNHYTDGGEAEHYSGEYSGHYSEGPESSSYTNDSGHAAHYADGGGEEGSYQTHSSDSAAGAEGGDYQGYHY